MGLFSTTNTILHRLEGLSLIQANRVDASLAKDDFKRTTIIAALAFMLVGSLSYIAMQSVASPIQTVAVVQQQPLVSEIPAATPPAQKSPSPEPVLEKVENTAAVAEPALELVEEAKDKTFLTNNGAIGILAPEREPYFVYATTKIAPSATPTCIAELRKQSRDATFYFGIGNAELGRQDFVHLASFGRMVNDCPAAVIHVTGHSDTSGNDLSNLDLSWKRADSTVNALVQLGIDTAQFEPVGFGARAPLSQGDVSDEGRNRRVEFHVLQRETDY